MYFYYMLHTLHERTFTTLIPPSDVLHLILLNLSFTCSSPPPAVLADILSSLTARRRETLKNPKIRLTLWYTWKTSRIQIWINLTFTIKYLETNWVTRQNQLNISQIRSNAVLWSVRFTPHASSCGGSARSCRRTSWRSPAPSRAAWGSRASPSCGWEACTSELS